MKKKIFYMVLVLTMMGSALTGCGKENTSSAAGVENTASVDNEDISKGTGIIDIREDKEPKDKGQLIDYNKLSEVSIAEVSGKPACVLTIKVPDGVTYYYNEDAKSHGWALCGYDSEKRINEEFVLNLTAGNPDEMRTATAQELYDELLSIAEEESGDEKNTNLADQVLINNNVVVLAKGYRHMTEEIDSMPVDQEMYTYKYTVYDYTNKAVYSITLTTMSVYQDTVPYIEEFTNMLLQKFEI